MANKFYLNRLTSELSEQEPEEVKYYIILRLFPDYLTQLNSGIFNDTFSVYNSLRVEIGKMDIGNQSESDEWMKFKLLHDSNSMDSPFKVFYQLNLTRDEVLEINDKLRTKVYADDPTSWIPSDYDYLTEGPIDIVNKLNSSDSFADWMNDIKTAITDSNWIEYNYDVIESNKLFDEVSRSYAMSGATPIKSEN